MVELCFQLVSDSAYVPSLEEIKTGLPWQNRMKSIKKIAIDFL